MGKVDFIKQPTSGLLLPSHSYKPFRYPWAYDFWQKQQQVHWMPEEVPLGEDCKDWANNITEEERNLLTQIFRFFTQSDVEVQSACLILSFRLLWNMRKWPPSMIISADLASRQIVIS